MMSEGRCPPPPPSPLLPVRHVYIEVSIVPACSLSRGTSRIISVSVTSGGTTMIRPSRSQFIDVDRGYMSEYIYIIATDTEIKKKKTKSQLLCRTAGQGCGHQREVFLFWQDSHVTVGTCDGAALLFGHNHWARRPQLMRRRWRPGISAIMTQ